jgi:hypothetical protein
MENVRLNSVASYNYCTHVTCEMCRTFSILNIHLILLYVHLEHCLRQENRCIGIVMVCLECVPRDVFAAPRYLNCLSVQSLHDCVPLGSPHTSAMATTSSSGLRHSARIKATSSHAHRDPTSREKLQLSRVSPHASRRPERSRKSKVALPESGYKRLSMSKKVAKLHAPNQKAGADCGHRRQQPGPFPLLALPRELRDIILSNLLIHEGMNILDDCGKFTTYNTSHGLRARYTLTKRYPRNILLVNHQLHDEFIEIITKQSQLRVQIGPYARSYETRAVIPRKTRQSAGEPNWEVIRNMKKCTTVVKFGLYMIELGDFRDDTLEYAWYAMFSTLIDFIANYGSSLKELYLELQLHRTVVTEQNGNPFELIRTLLLTEELLGIPCLKRVTVLEKMRHRFVARWEKSRPQWLCLGEAEPEYFRQEEKLFWCNVFDDN